MNILLPTTITDAMVQPGTSIPAVDTDSGEVAWASRAAYVIDDLRVYAGAVYSCVKAHSGSSITPDKDPTQWLYKQPSNQRAPFDDYLFTSARRPGEIVYVLRVPFATGISIQAIEGDRIEIAARSGTEDLIAPISKALWEQAFGEFEYLFSVLQQSTKFTVRDIPLRPDTTITIRVSRTIATVDAAVGFISVGQWRVLLAPEKTVGGTKFGAEAGTKVYGGLEKRNSDGTYKRVNGRVASVISATVLISAKHAPLTDMLLKRIANIPVAIEASTLPQFSHLSTVGYVSGTVTSENVKHASVAIKIEGNV